MLAMVDKPLNGHQKYIKKNHSTIIVEIMFCRLTDCEVMVFTDELWYLTPLSTIYTNIHYVI